MHLDLAPPSEQVYRRAAALAHQLAATRTIGDVGAIVWKAVDAAKVARWHYSETSRERETVKDSLATCAALCMIALATIEAQENETGT